MRWVRRAGAALAWTLIGLAALLVSVTYHLQLRLAGEVAIEAATGLLNEEIAGSLAIGELQTVTPWKVVARDVRVLDPQGREVIAVARVAAWPDWSALPGGAVRIGRVRARGGLVTLHVAGEESDTVSLAEAFQPARPGGPPGDPPRVEVNDIVLDEIRVRGDVPGFDGLRFEDLRVHGRVEAQRDVRFIVWETRGIMSGPYRGATAIDHIAGYFDSDLANEGLEFYARVRRGEDRVRARIRLRRPDPTAPPELELRVRAEPVRLATLHEMGVAPDLDALSGTVRGSASLSGRADDLALRGDLHSEAGSVRVRGRLPRVGPLRIEGETERLRLDTLIVRGPAMTVSGRAGIALEESEPGLAPVRRVHAALAPSALGELELPALRMEGVLEDQALRLEELEAEHAGARARVAGRVGFDGSVELRVSAQVPELGREPNVRRAAPELRGALSAELDVVADAEASNLRFDGSLTLRGLRHGAVRADRLSVRGRAGGTTPTPRLDLAGDAEGLRVGDLTFGHAELSVRGGPSGYDLSAQARDRIAQRQLEARGRATRQGETWRLALDRLELDVGDGPWLGQADLRITPGRDVRFAPVVLGRGHQRLALSGTYRFRGDDELDLQALNVDLVHARPLVPALGDVSGVVDASVALRGDLDREPQGRITGRIREGALGALRGVSGEVDLALEGESLSTAVRLELEQAGTLLADGVMTLPPSALRAPERLLDEARFDGLRVSAAHLDLGALATLLGTTELPVTARVTTDAALTGPLRRPDVRDAAVVLDGIRLEGWPELRAKLRLSLEGDRIWLRHGWLADARGELVTAEGDAPLPLDALPEDLTAAWQLLQAEPWSLSLRLPERGLDTWPEPLLAHVPPGLVASASVSAGNRDGQVRADLHAVARWAEAATPDACASELRPVFTVRGQVEHELASATLSGWFGGSEPELNAQLYAVLPFDEWIRRGDVGDFPATELVARLRGAELERIPWLCGYGSGPVHGSLTAKDLLTGRSAVAAVLDLPALRVWESAGERSRPQLSAAYRVHARAGSTPERDGLSACAILGTSADRGTPGVRCREVSSPAPGELISRLRVPVRWSEGSLLPEYVDGGTITSWTGLRDVHVAPVLTLIPGIVTGDAIMDGALRVEGTWPELRMNGAVDLREGHLQLLGLGQHLHDIEGRVELRGDQAIFPRERPISARDAGGMATAYGRVGFRGFVPREVSLRLEASDFPVRREGMVLAWLRGNAMVEGEVGESETRSNVWIRPREQSDPRTGRSFVVRLPDAAAGDLQPLAAHPEILVIGEGRPPEPGEQESRYPVHIRVDASDRFWVNRSDFSAEVSATLDATYRDPNFYVAGEATIRRGTFEIFGKRFELQPSTLAFDGGSELNPRVNISAVYEVPGRRGVSVTVDVSGTLTAPEINFSSTETSDRAEIIALLLSGGRRESGTAEREATEQAASFLAGLTAGILTLGLREEFGGVVPVRHFAIESEVFGLTRVRLGIDANELIPDFLRGLVLDAYIEGFVTAAADNVGTTAGPGGIGGGVTVEFTLPEGFLLRGTWVPVDHGSADLFFEPR